MTNSDIALIISYLLGAFGLGYTGALILLVFKKAVGAIF